MAKRTIRRIIQDDSGRRVIAESGSTILGTESPVRNSGADDTGLDDSQSGVGPSATRNGENFVDPTASSGGTDPDGNTPGRTRRGRPAGSRNQNKAVQGSLTSLLFSLHLMGATLLKVPELQLSEAEAKKLNDAVSDVMRFYTDMEIPPKVQAWLNLAMVGGMIYGPRFMAVSIRRKSRPKVAVPLSGAPESPRATPVQPSQSNVTPFRSPNAGDDKKASVPQPSSSTHVPGISVSLQEWSRWNADAAVIGITE
jgi:hypothetical protein